MYLRYLAEYYSEDKEQIKFGFFSAADYLQKQDILVHEEQEKLNQLIHWFDNNLPIPDYYQKEKNRQQAKSATSWYKDSAKKYIHNMNELAEILESHHVKVERIFSKKLLGKKIYEDEYQITIIPFRDISKNVI